MRVVVLLASLLAGCTTPSLPVEQPPLVEPPPPQPDETPQIRQVLHAFLGARWDFDYEAAHEFVTPQDAANPWHDPIEEQFAKTRHAELWVNYSWRINEVEVDGDVATARVELIGPAPQDTMEFHMRSSLMLIRATSRWLRDPKRQQAEMESVQPPRQVRSLVYQLRRVEESWRVYMDWIGARALAEERDAAVREEMFETFAGSERQLHRPRPKLDERTARLVEAVEQAERAVRDRDYRRARELYDALLVSDTAIPDFLSARRDSFDALEQQQQRKLAQAELELGPLREVDGRYEMRVKNDGPELRSFRLVAEYVGDDDDERHFRSLYEQKIGSGEARTVLVHPRRGKSATNVRLVNVRFMDREMEAKFHHPTDSRFQMRLRDLRNGGLGRSSAQRIADVFDKHTDEFDACGWPPDADPIDLFVHVDQPPRAEAARALTDSELGQCLSKVARGLDYPDAEDNRSVVRVYPPQHWWRQL